MFHQSLNYWRYSRFFVIGATALQLQHSHNDHKIRISNPIIWHSNEDGDMMQYTPEFDIALHKLERSCPILIDPSTSVYIHKTAEWNSRFKAISKRNQLIFVTDDINDDIVGVYGNVQCRVKNHIDSNNSVAMDYGFQLRVDPNYRRNGIASKLVDTQIKNRYHDSKLSYIEVAAENYKSVNLFQRKGYNIFGELCLIYSMPAICRIKYIKKSNLMNKTDVDDNKYIYNIDGNNIVIERICDSEQVVNLWKERFNEYGLLSTDDGLYDLSTSKEFKGIYKAYIQKAHENDTENEKFAMIGLYNQSEIQYPVITKCSIKMKILSILSAYFSENGQIDLLNAIRYLFTKLDPENDPFDLCKFKSCLIFGAAANCHENDNLLYKVLVEFVEQESLNKYNAVMVQHIMCKKDQDTFKKYIKSMGNIEVSLLSYSYDHCINMNQQIMPNNEKIWFDPRL